MERCCEQESTPQSKKAAYERLLRELDLILENEDDLIVCMSTISCLLYQTLDLLWAGFYRVKSRELVVGPYQGTLGCLRIPFEKGVCGACASRGKTIIVPDVHEFPDHIACDTRSNSEIVVPVFDGKGRLRAVLDLDAEQRHAFDELDARYLETLVSRLEFLNWSRED